MKSVGPETTFQIYISGHKSLDLFMQTVSYLLIKNFYYLYGRESLMSMTGRYTPKCVCVWSYYMSRSRLGDSLDKGQIAGIAIVNFVGG